jgi:transcriptional regulator with XRE-family HTH domain
MSMNVVTFSKNRRAHSADGWYKPPRGARLKNGDLSPLAKATRQAFIDNLMYWLAARGMKAADLAKALGVSPSTISNWKSGINFPSPDQFDRISEALDLPIAFLFWDPSDGRRESPGLQRIADLVDYDPEKREIIRKFYEVMEATDRQEQEAAWADVGGGKGRYQPRNKADVPPDVVEKQLNWGMSIARKHEEQAALARADMRKASPEQKARIKKAREEETAARRFDPDDPFGPPLKRAKRRKRGKKSGH